METNNKELECKVTELEEFLFGSKDSLESFVGIILQSLHALDYKGRATEQVISKLIEKGLITEADIEVSLLETKINEKLEQKGARQRRLKKYREHSGEETPFLSKMLEDSVKAVGQDLEKIRAALKRRKIEQTKQEKGKNHAPKDIGGASREV